MQVLGVRVDRVSMIEALAKARGFLIAPRMSLIFTPNPEMLVKAQWDEPYKQVLNAADLNLCDGRGLQLVTPERLERIPGVDFMVELCRLAEREGKSIFLLGSGSEEVVEKTARNLQGMLSKLRIVGVDKGPIIGEKLEIGNWKLGIEPPVSSFEFPVSGLEINSIEQAKLLNKINVAKPDILFVAFGMGKQEKWLFENKEKLPGVKIGMGVGGAFDFLSGKVKRAPLLMRRLGLEWVYRLWQEPWRIFRIGNATIRFFYYIIKA